jgi:hypothetical protein
MRFQAIEQAVRPVGEPQRAIKQTTPSRGASTAELRPPDHVDHVLSGSAELRPHQAPDHIAMMIAVKNGATTIATTVMVTDRKARGSDNFITADQISIKDKYTSNIYI